MIRLSQHQFLRILTSGRAAHQRQGRTHRRRRTQRRITRPRPSPATRPGLERRLSRHPTHGRTQDRPRSCPPTQTGGGASRHRLSHPSVAQAYSAQGSGSTLQGRAPALLRRTPPIPRKTKLGIAAAPRRHDRGRLVIVGGEGTGGSAAFNGSCGRPRSRRSCGSSWAHSSSRNTLGICSSYGCWSASKRTRSVH